MLQQIFIEYLLWDRKERQGRNQRQGDQLRQVPPSTKEKTGLGETQGRPEMGDSSETGKEQTQREKLTQSDIWFPIYSIGNLSREEIAKVDIEISKAAVPMKILGRRWGAEFEVLKYDVPQTIRDFVPWRKARASLGDTGLWEKVERWEKRFFRWETIGRQSLRVEPYEKRRT